MKFNLEGRLANFDLPYSKSLNPLFEAIVNSIHAIEEKFGLEAKTYGKIEVTILRNNDQLSYTPECKTMQEIRGFIIRDNGIGFNENNYESFNTSDSTYKLEIGGKGVGRFTWLKAFENVEVESVFDDNGFKKIKFLFTKENGISNENVEEIANEETYTIIKLLDMYSKYKANVPKRLDNIAFKVLEHCLSYFVLGNCPKIIIQEDNGETAYLNEIYKSKIDATSEVDAFKLGDYEFEIKHIKVFSSEALKNRIHWCANQREVIQKQIDDIPNLPKRLMDEDKPFSYSAYVSGQYLDQNVNPERTNFIGIGTEEDGSLFDADELSWKNISAEVHESLTKYLNKYLAPIKEEKMEKIRHYINSAAPEYRRLWQDCRNEIDAIITPEIANDESKMDLMLYKLNQGRVLKNKSEARKILDEDITTTEEYVERYEKVVEAVSDDGRADLARYVAQRKVILELLEKSMKLNSAGEYCYEKVIHNMIMPKGYTTDEIEVENHNLWIIDEKLAFHYYLASDKPLNEIERTDIKSEDRTDVLIVNNPSMFVEGDSYPFGSITLIEFKRPNRSNYSREDNPIDQIWGYIEKIRDGKCYDKDGQIININFNTPIYAYIICDITITVKNYFIRNDFIETPDQEGFYKQHGAYNAYVEVMPYRKLIADAKKRNRALFEHLHI